jgi:predicted ATP-grasp superfamily ATP-dependent carboligase
VVNSEQEICTQLPQIIENYGDCHLQQLIADGGKQYKVELFVKNGELINATVIHKIRFYPEKGGSSCFCQTIRNDTLTATCFSVLQSISWEGFADFDLIEDPADSTVKIMEINPRVPACVKACFNAGVNFADNIVCASLDKPLVKYDYRPGNYLRYLGLDLLWFIQSQRRFSAKPSWFRFFFRPCHALQDGGLNDLKPLMYGLFGGLIKLLNPGFRAAKRGMN